MHSSSLEFTYQPILLQDFEVHSEPAVHQESQKAMHEAIHQLKSHIVDLDNYYRHRLADLEYENRALVDKMRSGLRVERSQPEVSQIVFQFLEFCFLFSR